MDKYSESELLAELETLISEKRKLNRIIDNYDTEIIGIKEELRSRSKHKNDY